MQRESIFDMDVEILPKKYSGAAFLRGAVAVEATMDINGIGQLTTVEMFTPVTFQCKWEPYSTRNGHIIVYFEFPNRTSYLVMAEENFLDNIKVI